MLARIERYFQLAELGSDLRTEALAGATTFLTMSYIVFVNPAILAEAGMPAEAVAAATCLAAAFGSLLMGLWAKQPIALAPGMGINAYFAYSVVGGMGVPWQTALGAVFFSGLIFLALTLSGLREKILEAIPRQLYAAVAAGIGLFLALIGLRNAGIIVPNDATMVGLGDLSAPPTLLAVVTLLAVAALQVWRVRAAILIGIVGSTAAAWAIGLVEWRPGGSALAALGETAFAFDLGAALSLGFLEVIFVFLFVDMFDTLGTIIAVTKKAGLMDRDGRVPRIKRMLTADAAATTVGAMLGVSTTTSYIESAAGVAAGGRSGLTAVVAGLLFLAALPAASLVGMIPAAATAPALILVGALMMTTLKEIDWEDAAIAIPAFLTLLAIPLTYSIANGLAVGFIVYDVLQIAKGRGGRVPWLTHVLAALFLWRFVYLAQG